MHSQSKFLPTSSSKTFNCLKNMGDPVSYLLPSHPVASLLIDWVFFFKKRVFVHFSESYIIIIFRTLIVRCYVMDTSLVQVDEIVSICLHSCALKSTHILSTERSDFENLADDCWNVKSGNSNVLVLQTNKSFFLFRMASPKIATKGKMGMRQGESLTRIR